ncbi:MAG: hypothetical protein IH602_00190 [Bryobacteraceae bacterium]|nr:hypothetical protein [Bryobacteraceae bacterium]
MLARIQRVLRNQRFRKAYCWSVLGQFILINLCLFGFTLYADDCARDWTRAEDCLRTPGFAQTIGTGAGVIATILINGAAIQTILLTPPSQEGEGKGGEGVPPRQYYFDIRTEGGRSSLSADGNDSLWIYGEVRCTDPKIDCSGMTGGIGFSPGGTNWDWLRSGGSDYSGSMKAAQFTALAPAGATAPGSASIVATASVEGQTLSAEVPITLTVAAGEWELKTEPADPAELVPDSSQVLTLNARVKFDPAAFSPDVAQQLLQETQDNMKFTAGQWLDLSDPPTPMGEGFMAVNIAASDPSGEPMCSNRPESETVTISTSFNGQAMQTAFAVKIAGKPEVEVKPDVVSILGGSGDSFDVRAWITAPGPNSWTITTKFEEGDDAICAHSCSQEGPAVATVTISDSGAKESGAGVKYSWVTVIATDDVTGVEIKRGIRVSLATEGLVITKGLDQDGTLHVKADGKAVEKSFTFQLIAYDAESKQLVSDKSYLENLEFEFGHEPKTHEANVVAYCGLIHDCKIVYSSTPLTADYFYKAEKELPGEDRMTLNYTVSVPGLTGEEYTRKLPVTLEVMTLEQETEAKELEYERCREVIRKYIPAQFQQKLYTLVDEKKDKLGPKGLAKLRRKIWSIAVNYILAEGDEAYKEMEKWADRIVTVLEYAEAAGDIAFNAAAAAFLGPYGAMGAGFMKGALISAVQAYESGQDIMSWASQNLDSLYFIAEGQVIDVDTFEKALGGNRYKAWAYYVAMTFVLKLYRQKEIDFYQAAKDTAQDLAMEKFSSWLGQETAKSLGKHGIKYTGKGGDVEIVKPTGDGGDAPGVKPTDGPPKDPDVPPKQPDAPPKQPDGPPKDPDAPPKQPDGPPKDPDAPPKQPEGSESGVVPPLKPPGTDSPPKVVKPGDGPVKKPDDPSKKPDKPPEKKPEKIEKPSKTERDANWEKGKQQGKQKVKDLTDAIKSRDPEKVKQEALGFLKDKNAMMELNRDPGAGYQRQQVNKALKDVYTKVDTQVVKDLEGQYGKDNVRIFNATNPKKSTAGESTSYDRDITAQRRAREGELVRDPNAPGGFHKVQAGEERWVDVPAKDLESTYSKHFYGEANGVPPDKRGSINPKDASDFSKQHDQTCTDRTSNDSYGNCNKDLKTALGKPGDKFTDPGQISGVMEYKANEWYEKADHMQKTDPVGAEGCRAEGMRQTTKQWNNQALQRVDALKSQGVEVNVPKNLDSAMKEMAKVTKGEISPAEAEARIKNLGYDSPQQAAHDMGKFVEMLDKFRP